MWKRKVSLWRMWPLSKCFHDGLYNIIQIFSMVPYSTCSFTCSTSQSLIFPQTASSRLSSSSSTPKSTPQLFQKSDSALPLGHCSRVLLVQISECNT